jgi:hypothetical protein
MEIGLDNTPPKDNLEARHRAIRVRALACVVSGGARGRGTVGSAHRGERPPAREVPDESGGARGRPSTADRSSLKAGGDRPAQCDCARNTCLAQSCEAWHQRRTGGVVRPKGEPRGGQCANDRARHVLPAEAAGSTPPDHASAGCEREYRTRNDVTATLSCANERTPTWPSTGARHHGARSVHGTLSERARAP